MHTHKYKQTQMHFSEQNVFFNPMKVLQKAKLNIFPQPVLLQFGKIKMSLSFHIFKAIVLLSIISAICGAL